MFLLPFFIFQSTSRYSPFLYGLLCVAPHLSVLLFGTVFQRFNAFIVLFIQQPHSLLFNSLAFTFLPYCAPYRCISRTETAVRWSLSYFCSKPELLKLSLNILNVFWKVSHFEMREPNSRHEKDYSVKVGTLIVK